MIKKFQDFIEPIELIAPMGMNSELNSAGSDKIVITCYPGYICKVGEKEV